MHSAGSRRRWKRLLASAVLVGSIGVVAVSLATAETIPGGSSVVGEISFGNGARTSAITYVAIPVETAPRHGAAGARPVLRPITIVKAFDSTSPWIASQITHPGPEGAGNAQITISGSPAASYELKDVHISSDRQVVGDGGVPAEVVTMDASRVQWNVAGASACFSFTEGHTC